MARTTGELRICAEQMTTEAKQALATLLLFYFGSFAVSGAVLVVFNSEDSTEVDKITEMKEPTPKACNDNTEVMGDKGKHNCSVLVH
jgi:hypothetical protein